MMRLVYPACFYPNDEDDGYLATVPDLPGCSAEGQDLADTMIAIVDAASSWILDTLEDSETIPAPSLKESIELEYDDGFVNIIALDMDAYAEKYGIKAVRKNLTIPAWLNTLAEKQNINFSSVLQNALLEQLDITK